MLDADDAFAGQEASSYEGLASHGDDSFALRFGDYLLEEEIAHGGMGVVYRARQQSLDRVVALKLLLLGRYSSRESVERFRREAQAVATLRHPNIVAIYEVGEQEGQQFFTMEYIAGRNLAELLRDGPMAPRRAAEIARTIAEAIHYAHGRGVLHRDLKPSNVLIEPNGEVRITDFGLAKKLDGSSDLTVTGQMVGTPNYLSPEQAEGSHASVGPASDIYSIGALLYELLTGRPPFLAQSLQETLLRIRDAEPVSLRSLNPSLHRDLETICLKCLQKEPSRRYATAHELADDLGRWLKQLPIAARPAGAIERSWLWCKRKPRQAALVGLLGIAMIAIGALLVSIAVVSTKARQRAEVQELAAQRRAYAADINLVQQALDLNNLGRAEELLNQHRTEAGGRDLRDWEWRYLWQQCRDESLFNLCQRSNSVWALSISHDGQWLAVGEDKRSGLSVWNWRTRKPLWALPSGEGEVQVAFSPTEPLLAASYETGRKISPLQSGVRLMEARGGRVLAELPLEGRCRGLFYSGDGKRLLAATADPGNRLTIWDVSSKRKLVNIVAPQTDGVGTTVAATRDLSLAAFRTANSREICVVDLVSGSKRWAAKAADDVVTSLAFSADGRILASGPGYTESTIRLWAVETGKELGRLDGHTSWVSALVFWPDGKTLASSSADQTIRLWNLETQKQIGTLRGHRTEVWRLILLADGATLVSGSKNGAVKAWDTRTVRSDRRRIIFPETVAGWHFPSNGHSVLTVGMNGHVNEWTGATFSENRLVMNLSREVVEACVSADGARLAAQSADGPVTIWDLKRKTILGQFTIPGSRAYVRCFREGGKKLVMVNWGGDDFYEWDVESFKQTQAWKVNADRPSAAVSADGRLCMSIGQEGNATLRDLVTGEMTSGLLDVLEPGGIAISPDGTLFATVSKRSYARLWDLKSRREVATFRGFLQGLHGAAFSANGRRLAIGSNGREAVKLWDLECRQELLTLAGQGFIFSGLGFSPDGNILAARSNQRFLHLWCAPSANEIAAAEQSR